MTPQEIAYKAVEELQQFPQLPWKPDWHPYYWLGRLEAAKDMLASDTAAPPPTSSPSSNSPGPAGA